MSTNRPALGTQYVAFIDESGCDGLAPGSSPHFVLGGFVVRRRDESAVVQVVPRVKKALGIPPLHMLHYRNMGKPRRTALVTEIARESRLRAICIIVDKQGLAPGHGLSNPGYMYRFAAKLLAERISWLCDDATQQGSPATCELVFSQKKGTRYAEMVKYFGLLKAMGSEGIRWNVIDPTNIVPLKAGSLDPGLQIADAICGSVFSAIRPKGHWDDSYVLALRPVIYAYQATGRRISYGIKIYPSIPTCSRFSWTKSL